MAGKTQVEAETRAKSVLKRAGMDLFMEVESLAVDRESDRVFIVLKRKGAGYVDHRASIGHGSAVAGGVETEQAVAV